jgi:hypothetical protein
MTDVLWISIAAVALTFWAYRHIPLRAKDLGRISPQWLQEHRNETRER